MISRPTCRAALAGFIGICCIATLAMAGQQIKPAFPSPDTHGVSAMVTMASDVEIRVENIQLRESPGGQWISARPNRYASELYYRISKDNVTIRRVVPFAAISSVEFVTAVASDATNPEVRRMLIKLRDGGSIEWVHADRSIAITSAVGNIENWQSFPWISGVVSSGEKEQGQDYVITGFTGMARVLGEQGQWEATPTEIKSIRFIDGKVRAAKP
jgi:hypothetical protein